MSSPREDLRKALASKCLESLGAARTLLKHRPLAPASAVSRTYYAALQAVASRILDCRTIADPDLLASKTNGKGICRVKKGRWSFVHGGTQTHSDLVFPVAEDRRILKDLEGSRNTADYEEGQFSEDEVREMITDAEALLRTLGFRP